MSDPTARLPHRAGARFITDGGLETTLVFHDAIDLPHFAAFVLLETEEGTERLRRYYDEYAAIAFEHGVGLVLETPTWRASPEWATLIGYSLDELDAFNRKAVELMVAVRAAHDGTVSPIVISGCVGPHGDGYSPATLLTADEAAAYHDRQIRVFAGTEADLVTAITMTYAQEAIGVTRAARTHGIPVAISFTVETDGRLPSGQPLGEAITQVDDATDGLPAYYMVNCAHPVHIAPALAGGGEWLRRIGGLRVNASDRSHAELDEATELDEGDPVDLAHRHRPLLDRLPGVTVLGGCCGTDQRHVREIAALWAT